MKANSRKVHRSTALLPTLLITALLSACSSEDDEDAPLMDGQVDEIRPGLVIAGLNGASAEDLVTPWLVAVRLFQNPMAPPEFSEMSVDLFRYDEGLRFDTTIDFYTPELDTCEITDLGATGGGDGDDDSGGGDSISGGSTVTINSGIGPWVVMGRPNTDFPGYYLESVGELGVLPADATLSIPGDAFPNVPAYTLLDQPTPPVRLTPAAGNLSAADLEAPFTWVAMPDQPGGYIQIVGLAFDAAGNFRGFPLSCDVVDDGEFLLPQNVIDAFAGSELVYEVRYERAVARVDLVDGIAFSQEIQVVE